MRKWVGPLIVVAIFVILIVLFTVVLPPVPTWIYIAVSIMAMGALVFIFSRK